MWVRISIRARCKTFCDKVCQWLATGQWFSLGHPPIKMTEILLKMAFNNKKPKIKAKRDYSYKSTFSRQKGWTYKRGTTVHDLILNKIKSTKISPRLPNMESEWPYKRATTVHDLMLEKNVCIKISIIPSRDDLQKKYLFPWINIYFPHIMAAMTYRIPFFILHFVLKYFVEVQGIMCTILQITQDELIQPLLWMDHNFSFRVFSGF